MTSAQVCALAPLDFDEKPSIGSLGLFDIGLDLRAFVARRGTRPAIPTNARGAPTLFPAVAID